MKTTIISLAFLFISNGFAQKTYLKIYQNDSEKSTIMYPPGTNFNLKTKEGYIILKNSDTPRSFKIDDIYTLEVFPNYKDDIDTYKLSQGKIELVATETFFKTNPKIKTLLIDDKNVTSHKKLTDSKINKGFKNLEFELSNGIMFTYKDGKYFAELDDEYLDIQGKYYIESKLGILKLSFNPKNGEVWWVFE